MGMMQLSSAADYVLDRLDDAGHEVWLVGGCVRDSLRGLQPKDYDVATTALPFQTIDCFKNDQVAVTGLKHGTVTVVKYGEPVEVTTLRADGAYADGRHPGEVTFVSKLETDLARRDFTINAMAWNPETGYTDLFGGQEDLNARLVRCVGVPGERFAEDSLRIMRALRFAACLGFEIHEDTAEALHEQKESLLRISAERIAAELMKLLGGVSAGRVIEQYLDILKVIIPEIVPNVDNIRQMMEQLPPDPMLRLAVLLEPGRGALAAQRLKLDRVSTHRLTQFSAMMTMPPPLIIDEAVTLALAYGVPNLALFKEVWVARAGLEQEQRPWLLVGIQQVQQLLNRACNGVGQLAVGGKELMAAGMPPGPGLGRLLEELLAEVLSGACPNTREALLEQAALNTTQKAEDTE